jgi:hypothetical protein
VGREAGLSGPLWAFYGLGFVGLVLHSLERAMLNPFLFFFTNKLQIHHIHICHLRFDLVLMCCLRF